MGRRLNPFVPSPLDVVVKALGEAGLERDRVLVDLGSGDGRVPIAAARHFGARAVGVEVNGRLVEHSLRISRSMGLRNVAFVEGDARYVDLNGVDFVYAYLTTEALEALKPALLTAGRDAVVITHGYKIRGWTPREVLRIWSDTSYRYHTFYVYRVGDVKRSPEERSGPSGIRALRIEEFVPEPL